MASGSFRYSQGTEVVPGLLVCSPWISQSQYDYVDFSLLKLVAELPQKATSCSEPENPCGEHPDELGDAGFP